MVAGDMIREARLRAGLSQHQLAARTGRDRSVIARWEHGSVSPSLETLIEILHACGFDLPLELTPRETEPDAELQRNARLTPERRLEEALKALPAASRLDPYSIIGTLERYRVRYALIGALARVLHGADERPDSIDLAPARRKDNMQRLVGALKEMGVDADAITNRDEATVQTASGALTIVPGPPGTRGGYDDLRRAATREPIGNAQRPEVASKADLARILAARGDPNDATKLRQLRTLLQLERGPTNLESVSRNDKRLSMRQRECAQLAALPS